MSEREIRSVDMNGCARCEEGPHPGVIFERLDHPVEDADGTAWDWWATCPTTGQPILMRDE
jgi:hypothetical protein